MRRNKKLRFDQTSLFTSLQTILDNHVCCIHEMEIMGNKIPQCDFPNKKISGN